VGPMWYGSRHHRDGGVRGVCQVHKECVKDLSELLTRMDVDFAMVGREELDRQHLKDVDLVIAVGGSVLGGSV
jgi:hypothetical protein